MLIKLFSILLQKIISIISYILNYGFHTTTIKIKYMFLSELIAMQTQALLPIQECSQTSTDVQAHNFYNTLANYSYNIKYNYIHTLCG